eukprot:12129276-Prorocentrum_lima.AAC.1
MHFGDEALAVYRQIGHGGFGVVEAVKRNDTGHIYALKALSVAGAKALSTFRTAERELETLVSIARSDFLMGFAFSYAD